MDTWKPWSVDVLDEQGRSRLHWAAQDGDTVLVLRLLRGGASAETTDEDGVTPLQLAALEGHVGVCSALIGEGRAAAGAADAHRRTPLHFAAEEGHAEVVTFLVSHGAAVSAADCDGMTPLHLASEKGHAHVAVSLLEHRASTSAATAKHASPLHLASRAGEVAVAALLLEHGASVVATDTNGDTPLHQAATPGVARLLLEHHAPVRRKNSWGDTPLHAAAWLGEASVLEQLLDWDADVDEASTGDARQTPLMLAAWRGQLAATRLLCMRSAAVGALDRHGTSAAGAAAEAGHAEVLELLEAARDEQTRTAAAPQGGISDLPPRRSEGDAAALARAAAQRAYFASAVPPLGLPPEWAAAALKLAPLERGLVVHGCDPSTICPLRLLAEWAEPLGPFRRAQSALAGGSSTVRRVPAALGGAACAVLRQELDRCVANQDGWGVHADSVDAMPDQQVTLSPARLVELVGAAEALALHQIAERQWHCREAADGDGDGDDDDDAAGGGDDAAGDGGDAAGADIANDAAADAEAVARSATAGRAPRPAGGALGRTAPPSRLSAQYIFARRYSSQSRPWFPLHPDSAAITVNVALSDDAGHRGGRLVGLYGGRIQTIERAEGEAVVHTSALIHGVTRMSEGVRYSLILFFTGAAAAARSEEAEAEAM